MMSFKGWAVTAGLLLAASAANAQMLAPSDAGRPIYRPASDFDGPYDGPYAAMPPAPPPPVYNYGGYGPPLMPPQEVYTVLRDNGFSPLGAPHQRGFVYFIAVVDRRGDDGRLVIDARNGRILRFVPSNGYGPGPYGENLPPERVPGYGPEAALPQPTVIRGVPRPPGSVPHVASRAVPLPAPKPAVAGNPPAPAQQSAAIETKPQTQTNAQAPAQANASTSGQASSGAPVTSEAKPAPVIRPTQEMPKAQGLD